MKKIKSNCGAIFQNNHGKVRKNPVKETIIIVSIIVFMTIIAGLIINIFFNVQQMYIIRPILAASAVFIIFIYILRFRMRAYLFGEIAFIYLCFALAYTILPAIKFLMLDLNIPIGFDGLNFAVLSPQPAELGAHFWRHALFIFGVVMGFLIVRNRPLTLKPLHEKSACKYGSVIVIMIAIMGFCVLIPTLLSAPVTTYLENYIRFDYLSWPIRRLVELCLIFKKGIYFVVLALMFSQYRKYRMLIFIFVPLVCAYEVVFSFGSRIMAFTILLAFFGFYHFRVSSISLKKGMVAMIVLAFIFIGIEVARPLNYNSNSTFINRLKEKQLVSSEFEAVYCTGFHLYRERSNGTLPLRNWKMFFYDFISLLPFIDHTSDNPQYWYARNYFPQEIVPPTTMGIIAESAIWGGEIDLLIRSLLNGAIFALLTRWFLRRRDKWWALAVYIYCYAMCILTLKYSILNLLMPLTHVLLPSLLLAAVLIRVRRTRKDLRHLLTETNA
jgi:MFS family permease